MTVEMEGHTIVLVRCLDRYIAHANGLKQGGGEQIEIWEDEEGTVIRLSRALTPGLAWTAQRWV
ncbi:hypothetical protein [Deinococcus sp. QL22]|uniref:hypothetical protein n=1 Tax=Deinococcus sp. QL22 TaxID=2939437 RepID=UPI002017A646|nr:hypothetical protein [Deinococcus sp. QL22]UQN10122.1 hypothetical protein M1R55_28455 [Deinococcus sp. QL22]